MWKTTLDETVLLLAHLFQLSTLTVFFCVFNAALSPHEWSPLELLLNGCMCFQVWRQRACIASVGTRQTRTTFRNSLIKVKHSSAQTHACSSSNRPMNTYLTIKKSEERACIAGFSKHGGKQSLLVSQNVFRNYFPINLNRAVIRTWEFFGKHFQNQAAHVWCVQCI